MREPQPTSKFAQTALASVRISHRVDRMENPAEVVIRVCGGARAVGEMLGLTPSRVHRWTYPRRRGGTDGQVPTKHQATLLMLAREKEIPLKPEHFFPNQAASHAA